MPEAIYGPKRPQSGGDCGLTQTGLQTSFCCPQLFGTCLHPRQTQFTAVTLLASKSNYDNVHSINVREREGELAPQIEVLVASNY